MRRRPGSQLQAHGGRTQLGHILSDRHVSVLFAQGRSISLRFQGTLETHVLGKGLFISRVKQAMSRNLIRIVWESSGSCLGIKLFWAVQGCSAVFLSLDRQPFSNINEVYVYGKKIIYYAGLQIINLNIFYNEFQCFLYLIMFSVSFMNK